MNKEEAKALLDKTVADLQARSYEDIEGLSPENPEVRKVEGHSGALYQVEISAFREKRNPNQLRVWVSIDDFGLRALSPLTHTFTINVPLRNR